MTRTETWHCQNCSSRNRTDWIQRTCNECFELRSLVLTFAEAIEIYSTIQQALKECHRDLGTDLFIESSTSLKELVNDAARSSLYEIKPDEPLVQLYIEKSPGGIGILAQLGFEIEFGTIKRSSNNNLTPQRALQICTSIDSFIDTIKNNPKNYLPEIDDKERKFIEYEFFMSLPDSIRSNPTLSTKRVPQKPPQYDQLKIKYGKFNRPLSLYDAYIKKLKIENDQKRRTRRDQSKDQGIQRLTNAQKNQNRSQQTFPCSKGQNCYTAVCPFTHPVGRTPVCNQPACVNPDCFNLHSYPHINQYEEPTTTLPTQSYGKPQKTTPHINPFKPTHNGIVYPIIYGTGCREPEKFAKIECRNPVCRVFRCEFSHQQFKRPQDCPEAEKCPNLQKYIYYNDITQTYSNTADSKDFKRVENPHYCKLIHPRDARRSLGPNVEIDCPFWKDLSRQQSDVISKLAESNDPKDRAKLMPGEPLFPGCLDCFCEFNHPDQKKRDLKFYRKFGVPNPRSPDDYEPFKFNKNLSEHNDGIINGDDDDEDPFAILGKNESYIPGQTTSVIAQQQKKSIAAVAVDNNNNNNNKKDNKDKYYDQLATPTPSTTTKRNNNDTPAGSGPTPQKLTMKFSDMAKLGMQNESKMKQQQQQQQQQQQSNNDFGGYEQILYTSQYSQEDLDTMVAILGFENVQVINDGPFLPNASDIQKQQEEELYHQMNKNNNNNNTNNNNVPLPVALPEPTNTTNNNNNNNVPKPVLPQATNNNIPIPTLPTAVNTNTMPIPTPTLPTASSSSTTTTSTTTPPIPTPTLTTTSNIPIPTLPSTTTTTTTSTIPKPTTIPIPTPTLPTSTTTTTTSTTTPPIPVPVMTTTTTTTSPPIPTPQQPQPNNNNNIPIPVPVMTNNIPKPTITPSTTTTTTTTPPIPVPTPTPTTTLPPQPTLPMSSPQQTLPIPTSTIKIPQPTIIAPPIKFGAPIPTPQPTIPTPQPITPDTHNTPTKQELPTSTNNTNMKTKVTPFASVPAPIPATPQHNQQQQQPPHQHNPNQPPQPQHPQHPQQPPMNGGVPGYNMSPYGQQNMQQQYPPYPQYYQQPTYGYPPDNSYNYNYGMYQGYNSGYPPQDIYANYGYQQGYNTYAQNQYYPQPYGQPPQMAPPVSQQQQQPSTGATNTNASMAQPFFPTSYPTPQNNNSTNNNPSNRSGGKKQ